MAGAPAEPALPWHAHAVANCPALLAASGVSEYRSVQPEPEFSPDGRSMCFVPQAVHYQRGPEGLRYSTYMLLNCRMAAAVARFETVAADVVRKVYGPRAHLKTVLMLGAYQCRTLREKRNVMSQHSFGGAIDVRGFVIDGVGQLDVDADWTPGRSERSQKAARFFRALVAELKERRVFENLLTPDHDADHGNHLHFDLDPLHADLPEVVHLSEPRWGLEPEAEEELSAPVPLLSAPMDATRLLEPADER